MVCVSANTYRGINVYSKTCTGIIYILLDPLKKSSQYVCLTGDLKRCHCLTWHKSDRSDLATSLFFVTFFLAFGLVAGPSNTEVHLCDIY